MSVNDLIYPEKMRRKFQMAQENRPHCVKCDARLAYDRINEESPVCGPCGRIKMPPVRNWTAAEIHRAAQLERRASEGKVITYLKEIRTKRGLQQKDLAAITGIPRSTLSAYEHGRRVPYDSLELIADALGVEVRELEDA